MVKLVDFGIAAPDTQNVGLAGTIEYMAPELFLGGGPSPASDLWAAGILFHQLLTGRFPFGETKPELAAEEPAPSSDATASPSAAQLLELYRQSRESRPPSGEATAPLRHTPTLAEPSLHSQAHSLAEEVKLAYEGPFRDILLRLLARCPEARYSDASQALQDLAVAAAVELPVETQSTRESFLVANRLIGRERELAVLKDALRSAMAGRGAAWMLAGESGVGKSRLLAEVRTLALVHGAWVAEGQAIPEGASFHQEWISVLRTLCLRIALEDSEAEVLKEILPEISSLLNREIGNAPPLSPEAMQKRLHGTIEQVFRRSRTPIVLLLEDLHWVSADCVTLLSRLCELAQQIPLLIIGTYREEDHSRLAPILALSQTLRLERLGAAEIAKLTESMLGAEHTNPELVEYLFNQTEGNVFFLVEVVRALAERMGNLGEISHADLSEQVRSGGIEKLLQHRLARVSGELEQSLLELAAVQGRHLELRVLEQFAPAHQLESWLIACANADILESQNGTWRFTHDRLREVLLLRLQPAQRQRLHSRIAEALEQSYPGEVCKSSALAHHYRQAGNAAQALAHYQRAGTRALTLHVHAEAKQLFAGALWAVEELPDSPEVRWQKLDILVKQTRASLWSESGAQNLARLNQASELFESLLGGRQPEGKERLLLGWIRYLLGRIHFYAGQTGEAVNLYKQVLPIAEEFGDLELLALPSLMIGLALWIRGYVEKSRPFCAQAMAPLAQLGHLPEWSRAVGHYGAALIAGGEPGPGWAHIQKCEVRAREINQPGALAFALACRSFAHLFLGNWTEMALTAHECWEAAKRAGEPIVQYLALSHLGWAEGFLGEIRRAHQHRAQAQEIAARLGRRLFYADWFEAADAMLAYHAGDPVKALALAQQLVATSSAQDLPFSLGLAERTWSAALAKLEPKRTAEIDIHMQSGLDTLERCGHVLEVAHTRVWWMRILRARGEQGEAEKHAAIALAVFDASGCSEAAAELRRELS